MNWVGRYNDDDLIGYNRDLYLRPSGITNSEVIQLLFYDFGAKFQVTQVILDEFYAIYGHTLLIFLLINIYNRIYLPLKKMGRKFFFLYAVFDFIYDLS